ncbi:MAG: glycosyltransferase [Planctomycetaceae bacterium]|nr:glycosyltransferase [Planctomycetaceae bacterium]
MDTSDAPPTVLETRVVSGTGGGPDKTILNTPRFLEPYGYRTVCAYFHPPEDPGFDAIRRRAEASSAPLIALPDRGPFDVSLIRRTLDVCRRENVVAWHGHDYKSNLLGLIIRRWHPMRLLTTVHGWVFKSWKASIYFRVDRWCLRRYERVICVSPDLVEECLKGGVPRDRVQLIENAIDVPNYERTQSKEAARRQFGIAPEQALIVAVGRLSPEKNFRMLIQSAARLISEGRNIAVAIAGEGSQREELQALIASTGYADRIRLVGFLSDPRPLYEAADVYALSSDREGLPNVLLEAMAYSLPVVSTAVAGVPRLIQDGANGLLTPIADEPSFFEALRRVVDEVGLRQRLGDAGRATIEARYTFDNRMRQFAAVYAELQIPKAW